MFDKTLRISQGCCGLVLSLIYNKLCTCMIMSLTQRENFKPEIQFNFTFIILKDAMFE